MPRRARRVCPVWQPSHVVRRSGTPRPGSSRAHSSDSAARRPALRAAAAAVRPAPRRRRAIATAGLRGGSRLVALPRPGAVDVEPAPGPPQPGGGRPLLRDGGRGRQLSGHRLPHPRRDGRASGRRRSSCSTASGSAPGGRRVADGDVVHAAAGATSGWTSARSRPAVSGGITRTDVAPDGVRAGLIGLRLASRVATTVPLTIDAHSELMKSYPWGETTPSQTTYNLQDTGKVVGGALVFREQGTPPVQNTDAHDYAALRRLARCSPRRPPSARTTAVRRTAAVNCGPSGPDTPPTPERCDDTAYGKGTGGRLTYARRRPGRGPDGLVRRRRLRRGAGSGTPGVRPGAGRTGRHAARHRGCAPGRSGRNTRVSLPGDRLLEQSVDVEQAEPRRVRAGGTQPAGPGDQRREEVPAPTGTRRPGPLVRRRLARLPVDLRHRRRVHRLRGASQPASSSRSRTTCAPCATSRSSRTGTAARSSTR